jgi:nucleoid-associated protein YgaU
MLGHGAILVGGSAKEGMRLLPMRRLLVPVLVVACAGCGPAPEGSRGSGVIVTADGRFVPNTDVVQRSETVKHIQEDVDRAIAPGWHSLVAIDELPVWHEGILDGDWRWQTVTATVTLRGSGPLAVSEAELKTGIERYLAAKAKQVRVKVERAAVPVASVPLPREGSAIGAPPAGPRTYTVQPGDTLADISVLFYGAPEAWRQIIAANPGLDPAKLVPGTVLVIPPRP